MSKKKKEKIIYYDDGMTISDMSSVNRKGQPSPPKKKKEQPSMHSVDPRFSNKSKWQTYWAAVRMMLVPTLVVLGIITLFFLCMYAFGRCAA